MNGMSLSRDYFFKTAEPALKRDFPGLYPRLAAGLVGNGSECFGFDDEISRDHDWGVDFFLWTLPEDSEAIPALSQWKNDLFMNDPPDFARTRSEYGARIGVMTCGDFYSGLIGAPEQPKTLKEWLRAPEENYAMAVNGEVFIDLPGVFSKTRCDLLRYYPEDIRRKRIAAKCMALAQTGQYNHERVARRRDWVTLRSVVARFTDSAVALAFHLNKTYLPYYKWAFTALKGLPARGAEIADVLFRIAETGGLDETSLKARQELIEELCGKFVLEMKAQGLSGSEDGFLTVHGEEVRSGIRDDFLRSLPAQYEI